MKTMKKYILLTFVSIGLAACSIDETNYTSLNQDFAYSTKSGYNALVNACYENVYYLYGKSDGIGPMEMGTDLWMNGSRNGGSGDITNYNEDLTPNCGVLKTVWNSLYCIVGYCNTAIYYQDKGSEFTAEEMKPKVAEARFLRAFANFHIVEQWGNVVLNKTSFAESGVASETAYRSPESDFYDLIISDLKFAVENLPVAQTERGRATKKAAMGMLAKAYLQRTRLYDEGSAECKAYADSAFQVAKELIDNSATYQCSLYASDATQSGFAKCWADDNNKSNQEFLFVEAVDHENGYNPEGWNRGRTSQYYMMKISSAAQNFGVASSGIRYRRDNATIWRPTLYLLQQCFEPKMSATETLTELKNLAVDPTQTTPDTRFENSFYYKYYATNTTAVLKKTMAQYGKDTLLFNWSKASQYTITGNALSAADVKSKYPGTNYYCDNGNAGADLLFEMENVPNALGCYTPNWDLDTTKCKSNKRLVVGPNMYYNTSPDDYGDLPKNTYFKSLFPSLKKFSCFKYLYTNQYSMMDIPILRMTDIYLIAAEASITMGEPSKGLDYLNEVRRHAALSTNAAKMEVTLSDMTIDYILKERARELCGEQWRWYDLKRTRRLTSEYLSEKGKNPFITTFDNKKNLVRPVPQQFLDQISNPDEFGTNGY